MNERIKIMSGIEYLKKHLSHISKVAMLKCIVVLSVLWNFESQNECNRLKIRTVRESLDTGGG